MERLDLAVWSPKGAEVMDVAALVIGACDLPPEGGSANHLRSNAEV